MWVDVIVGSQSVRSFTVDSHRSACRTIYSNNNDGDRRDECHGATTVLLSISSFAQLIVELMHFSLWAQSERKDFQFDSYSVSVDPRPV